MLKLLMKFSLYRLANVLLIKNIVFSRSTSSAIGVLNQYIAETWKHHCTSFLIKHLKLKTITDIIGETFSAIRVSL